MSEMVRHKGIIKKLSTPETLMEVFEKLVAEGKINREHADIEDGIVCWIDEDEYDIINGCLFDVSGAPQEYDAYEEVDDADKLNESDYRIHIYYYNGGDSPIDDAIARADKEYNAKTKKTSKEIMAEAIAQAKLSELEAFVLIQEIFEEKGKQGE